MSFERVHVFIFCGFLIALGMVGLYAHIEYSGWLIAVGLFGGLVNFEKDNDVLTDAERAEIWEEGFRDHKDGLSWTENPYKS